VISYNNGSNTFLYLLVNTDGDKIIGIINAVYTSLDCRYYDPTYLCWLATQLWMKLICVDRMLP
jgi:hypothetical protein